MAKDIGFVYVKSNTMLPVFSYELGSLCP